MKTSRPPDVQMVQTEYEILLNWTVHRSVCVCVCVWLQTWAVSCNTCFCVSSVVNELFRLCNAEINRKPLQIINIQCFLSLFLNSNLICNIIFLCFVILWPTAWTLNQTYELWTILSYSPFYKLKVNSRG